MRLRWVSPKTLPASASVLAMRKENLRKAIAPFALAATVGAVGVGTANASQASPPSDSSGAVFTIHHESSGNNSHLVLKLGKGASFTEKSGKPYISYQGKQDALPTSGKDKTGSPVDVHYTKAANGNIQLAATKKSGSNKTTPYDWKCAAGTGGGAGGGAIAGGAAGATIGSALPGPGTVAGWAIGTAIGGAVSGGATGAAASC